MAKTRTRTRRAIEAGALLAAAWVVAIASTGARAATISLQPTTSSVALGGTVEILIYGSGFPDGVDGGDLRLHWTESLSYVGLTVADPPFDLWSVSDEFAHEGFIDWVDVFATFETPGIGGAVFEIATLVLQATSEGEASVFVTGAYIGWSLGGETLGDVAYLSDVTLQITAAPTPATLSLLLEGLCVLAWLRRRA